MMGYEDGDGEVLRHMIAAARAAGEIVRSAHSCRNAGRAEVSTKSNPQDLVTLTDLRSQREIFSRLRALYPSSVFVGEEDQTHDESWRSHSAAFIVDPVDGTTNFVHGLRDVAICIAFVRHGIPHVGVVYNPIQDTLYHGVRGQGAFRNALRIHVSGCTQLALALVCTEVGSARDPDSVRVITRVIGHLMEVQTIRGMRMLGSGALDLCYVADGTLDAVYAGVAREGWHIWDHAAASVIVHEAGGVLKTCRGEPFDIASKSVLCCASPQLAEALVRAIKSQI
ncbi:Inositol monophosphatase 1 [Porphyridium purpureum]|uniref:Inositol-1-monophosphatase n=1 Tax=Porphyridium purpureum TaxID=35688 RepID=A0A5J4YPP5_PORPP|nr:Inositol monophosphatase 1 [Porphyridium purpureum]|eukprot:POR3170..scf236_6